MKKLLITMTILFFASCSLEKFERSVADSDNESDIENSNDSDMEEISDEGTSEIDGVVCTGQKKCYDNNEDIDCPSQTGDFYGTDAFYAMSGDCLKRDFSILDSGPEKIVIDNNTGLQWQRNYPQEGYSWEDAISYCKNLNYGGYSDWRLPDQSELWTIVDFGSGISPAINADIFPSTQADYFWTSSKDSSDSSLGVFVHFLYGISGKIKNTSSGYVRCVRGKYLPSNDFKEGSVKGDKTLSDASTGLVWSLSYAAGRIWKDALGYCESLNYGGKRNWKLPNINELKTLFNNGGSSLISAVPEIPHERFWSSTTASLYSASYAMSLEIGNGDIQFESKQDSKYVICVSGKIKNDTEECDSDNGCSDGYECISGVCYESIDECISDDECKEGFECFEDKCIPEGSFISKWNTAFYGVSSEKQITLPLVENGTYDFTVFWGDGSYNKITKWNDPAVVHTYPEPGIYSVIISGTFEGWQFCEVTDAGCAVSDATKIIDVSRWSGLVLGDTEYQFAQCWNLDITAKDAPDLSKTKSLRGAFANCNTLTGKESFNDWDVSGIENMSGMFYRTDKFNQDISSWDVSNVTDMSYAFSSARLFNADLSGWDVSKVTDMSNMFENATDFNSDLSDWNVSKVTDMDSMFYEAAAFNHDLSTWDVLNVTDMGMMFFNASSFNSDLSDWNVSKVTDMSGMFFNSSSFNSDLSKWDVSEVISMWGMFYNAQSFNCDLSGWNVSKVTNMSSMFLNAALFNSDLSEWDVSSVEDMSWIFAGTALFNSDISSWDVSNVKNMCSMFDNAPLFNSDISEWDVSKVEDMSYMFASANTFNSDISGWDVSSVINMSRMFNNAISFDQDLSDWQISSVLEMEYMFYGVTLSTVNYDAILNGWSELTLQNNVDFHGGNSKYSTAAEAARAKIISDFNWTITDGGLE